MLKLNIKKDILGGNITQQLMLLFFPLLTGYLLQQAYGFVDNIILGRLVSKQALAAVGGSATSFVNITNNFINGITAAITVVVAQNYGRGNMEKISKAIRSGMFIAITLGVVLTIVTNLAAHPFLSLMKEPTENVPLSLTYMRCYLFSLVQYFVYQTGVSILRASGDTRRPIYFILIATISKILLDLLFAGAFRMGVLGTSLATFFAHTICAIVVLLLLEHTSDVCQYSLKHFRDYDKEDLRNVFAIGIPFAIQSMMFAIPNAVLQSRINQFGTNAIAAYTAYSNIDNFFWSFSNAVSTAAITVAGQNFGHHNIGRVRKTMFSTMMIDGLGGILIGGFFLYAGRQLLSIFVTDPEVVEISYAMLRIVSFTYFTYGPLEAISAISKGCGMAKTPMFIAIFTICITRILYIILYPQTAPHMPVFAYPLSWIITSIVYLIFYYTRKELKVS